MGTRPMFVPITEARAKLADLVDESAQRAIVLVRRSRPVAILLSLDNYEALLERIEHAEVQAAILHGELHPEESISHAKLEAELGLKTG